MTTVKLHGWLGKKYGKTFKLAVNSPAQAISVLRANFKEFANDVARFSGEYQVIVGKSTKTKDELCMHTGENTIRIVPVVSGRGGRGVLQTFIGVVLIAASFFPAFSAFSPQLMSTGIALVAGGVLQMLTPVPKLQPFSSEKADNKPSYAFTGAINTTGQGNPVPILYGKMLIGSQVGSFGISTRQI